MKLRSDMCPVLTLTDSSRRADESDLQRTSNRTIARLLGSAASSSMCWLGFLCFVGACDVIIPSLPGESSSEKHLFLSRLVFDPNRL